MEEGKGTLLNSCTHPSIRQVNRVQLIHEIRSLSTKSIMKQKKDGKKRRLKKKKPERRARKELQGKKGEDKGSKKKYNDRRHGAHLRWLSILPVSLIDLFPMLLVLQVHFEIARRHLRARRVQFSGAVFASDAGKKHVLCVGGQGLAGLLGDCEACVGVDG